MSKLGLTIALLPLLTISNIIMAASNLSSSSLDWQIFNSPIGLITNTTNIVPYQYTEILDDNYELIKFRYNFTTGNFPQGTIRTLSKQTQVENFRVDGYEDFKIDLNVSLTQGAQTFYYDSYLQVNYLNRPSRTLVIKVYYWRGPTTTCSSSRVILSGIEFGFKIVKADEYSFEACSPSPISMSFTFDLTYLSRYLLSEGLINMWDLRKTVKVYVRTQGAGQVTLSQKAYHIERIQHIFRQFKNFGEYYMANQPFFQSYGVEDFMNLSLPINGLMQGIISQAYFITPNPMVINGHHWILVGVFYSQWKTPIYSYGLPAEVHTNINLFVNFSFTPEASTPSGSSAACYLLNFRDDYNPETQRFENSNNRYISRQFIIAVWASEVYRNVQQGTYITSIYYFGVYWKILKINNQYLIQAQSNLVRIKNFDVFAFVRYLRYTLLQKYLKASLSFGKNRQSFGKNRQPSDFSYR